MVSVVGYSRIDQELGMRRLFTCTMASRSSPCRATSSPAACAHIHHLGLNNPGTSDSLSSRGTQLQLTYRLSCSSPSALRTFDLLFLLDLNPLEPSSTSYKYSIVIEPNHEPVTLQKTDFHNVSSCTQCYNEPCGKGKKRSTRSNLPLRLIGLFLKKRVQ